MALQSISPLSAGSVGGLGGVSAGGVNPGSQAYEYEPVSAASQPAGLDSLVNPIGWKGPAGKGGFSSYLKDLYQWESANPRLGTDMVNLSDLNNQYMGYEDFLTGSDAVTPGNIYTGRDRSQPFLAAAPTYEEYMSFSQAPGAANGRMVREFGNPYSGVPEWALELNKKGQVTGVQNQYVDEVLKNSAEMWNNYIQASIADNPRGGGFLGKLVSFALPLVLGPAGLGLSPIVAGAVGGGLTSAISGGDPLKGAVLGGVTGGISEYAPPAIGSQLKSLGVTSPLAQAAITRGLTSSAIGAVHGADPMKALLQGAVSGGVGQYLGANTGIPKSLVGPLSQMAGVKLTGGNITPEMLVRGFGNQLIQQAMNQSKKTPGVGI